MTTNTIEQLNIKQLAKAYVDACNQSKKKGDAFDFFRTNAAKTPTGRITKSAGEVIKRAEAEWNDWQQVRRDLEGRFEKAMYAQELANAGETRAETVAALTKLFGNNDVTHLWAERNVAYHALKNKEIEDTNGYKKGSILVLDVTPNTPEFKNVLSISNRHIGVSKLVSGDVYCHLWIYINTLGKISRVKMYDGKVSEMNLTYPTNDYLENSFGTDIERGVNAVCASSFNGTTSEMLAWGATLMLIASTVEKIQPLLDLNRGGYRDNLEIAQGILAQ
jgi:hypothetical protein